MIDLSVYDMKKVNGIDKFFMLDAQRMNQMQWEAGYCTCNKFVVEKQK